MNRLESVLLSVVVPIYNEESNIQRLQSRLQAVLESITVNYEIIYVNDGSKDQSLLVIQELAKSNGKVKYVDFSRNFGHQIAVMAGLDRVRGKAVVIIDADMQDPPELIASLYAKLQEGYQVVYAKRRKRSGESVLKLLTAKLFYRLLSKITSVNIPIDTGDFRIIDEKVVKVLKQMPEKNKFLRGQIAWVGFRQTYVEYDRAERQGGSSGYTYRKMLRFALDGITSFSDWPLKIATVAGFTVSGVSFIVLLYALYGRLFTNNYVPGWASVITSILFLGGIQLISLGIIGEYLSRLSINARNRPLYIVNESNIEEATC